MSDLDADDSEWDILAERSGNVFATRQWLSTWWRHFGRGHPLVARARGPDGRLVAILPLYAWSSRPLRIIRFLGHGVGDELGPIHAPEDRLVAIQAVWRLLAESPLGWDLLIAEQLSGGGWDQAFGGRLLREHGNPVLRFESEDWEGFLRSRSRNFREQLRRKERRLAREHRLVFRLADDPLRLQRDLDHLFRLHASRWAGLRSAFGGPREAFQREFAADALRNGWLRLWFLELDGEPAAAWYGFRFAGREAYYQSGREPRLERLSVGTVLLAHSIRAALEDGLAEYRFLRGDDPYKYRFANVDPRLQTVGVASSRRGRVALAAGAATRHLDRFPAVLRRPLGL